jgi:ABC-2 type transport system ATP-binding protein
MNDRVILVENLSKSYQHGWLGGRAMVALRQVNLDIHRGEVFGLLGPNGAGKTTLIKLLLGIIHPSSGSAWVLNEVAGSRLARECIGYLPENLVFPRHHTGESALYFYGRLSGLAESTIRRRIPALIDLVGLTGREGEWVRKYSKGMKQRLGLAQALLHEPEILILDEPTDGLDPLGRSQMRDLIEHLRRQGKSVFLNSHILQEVELVCDRVAIMAKGMIRAIGTIEELVAQHTRPGGLVLELEVQGSESSILETMVGSEVEQIEQLEEFEASIDPFPSRRYLVRLVVADQAGCDRWLDRIRQSGVSLIRLQRQRVKLEEIFVRLVSQLEQAAEVEEGRQS